VADIDCRGSVVHSDYQVYLEHIVVQGSVVCMAVDADEFPYPEEICFSFLLVKDFLKVADDYFLLDFLLDYLHVCQTQDA